MENTKLTVAKLCHEISGYLSVIKFIEYDVKSEVDNENVKALFTEVDNIVSILEFFRSLYSVGDARGKILDHVYNIYKNKGISITKQDNILNNCNDGYDETILAGILYLTSKLCKKNSHVNVRPDGELFVVEASDIMFASNIFEALCDDNVEKNIFNILAKYVRSLINAKKYKIAVDALSNSNVIIKLYR
mgnify:CR=1 FL=1